MSLEAVADAMKRGVLGDDGKPDSNAKLLLLILSWRAGPDGVCWPSQHHLMEFTGLSERTVRDKMKLLKDRGALSAYEFRRADGSRGADTLVLNTVCSLTPEEREMLAAETAERRGGRPANSAGGQPADAAEDGAKSAGHEKNRENTKVRPPKPPSEKVAAAIWAEAPRKVRQRSSLKLLTDAVTTALKNGADPQALQAGAIIYLQSDDRDEGNFLTAAHRIITQERWREFAPAVADNAPQDDSGIDALFGAPVSAQTVQNDPAAAVLRQHRGWLEEYVESPATWRPERGPPPGMPGCVVTRELLAEYGLGGGAHRG